MFIARLVYQFMKGERQAAINMKECGGWTQAKVDVLNVKAESACYSSTS